MPELVKYTDSGNTRFTIAASNFDIYIYIEWKAETKKEVKTRTTGLFGIPYDSWQIEGRAKEINIEYQDGAGNLLNLVSTTTVTGSLESGRKTYINRVVGTVDAIDRQIASMRVTIGDQELVVGKNWVTLALAAAVVIIVLAVLIYLFGPAILAV